MARRKPPPAPPDERAPVPAWVRRLLPGLTKFDGDLAALGRARAQWCRDHHCYRPGPCSDRLRAQCQAGQSGRTGKVRVVGDGAA